jgi:hypothetical protein
MKNKLLASFISIAFILFAPNALAGKWVGGKGETIKSAIENAKVNAKKRIKKRGSGCVDGKTRNPKKNKDAQGNTYWTIDIYTHNHNGSCGK